jgi:hypothetical protein
MAGPRDSTGPVVSWGPTFGPETADDRERPELVRTGVEHLPEAWSWDCKGCRDPWPCASRRERLLRTMSPQDIGLLMDTYRAEMQRDLKGMVSPAQVYERLYGWIHTGATRRRGMLHPPGGSL